MINLFIQLHEQLANLGVGAFVLEGRDASGKEFIKHLLQEDVPFTLRHQGNQLRLGINLGYLTMRNKCQKRANS